MLSKEFQRYRVHKRNRPHRLHIQGDAYVRHQCTIYYTCTYFIQLWQLQFRVTITKDSFFEKLWANNSYENPSWNRWVSVHCNESAHEYYILKLLVCLIVNACMAMACWLCVRIRYGAAEWVIYGIKLDCGDWKPRPLCDVICRACSVY